MTETMTGITRGEYLGNRVRKHPPIITPKGIAKGSGILEGSDFNIESIYERLRKGPKKKD